MTRKYPSSFKKCPNFLSNYAFIHKTHEYTIDKYQMLILMMIAVKTTLIKLSY